MALKDVLAVTNAPSAHLESVLGPGHTTKKIGLSEERLAPIKPYIRQYIAFWREYPDLFIDFLQKGGDPNTKVPKDGLHFFFYQRVFLRVCCRYKYVYCVFPRAYSKSFLANLALMIKCILYPRAKLCVTSGGKEQAAGIVKEKVTELCNLIPALARELDRRRNSQATREGKDYVKYVFKNGSYFDNVAATERSRGGRRNYVVGEEVILIDGDLYSSVILPMLNVDRKPVDGSAPQKDETLNKGQLYITTAGYKGTFSYNKLIQLLVWMATEPEKAFVMGGTYRIPVIAGLQSEDFISDMKRDGTFNEIAFKREYESEWAGTSDNAFFDGEAFDRNRILKKAEYEANGRNGETNYYVIGVDVGRKGDLSAITVFKVIPQPVGPAIKNLVNIYSLEDSHFEDQAINLKKLYYKYHARRIVMDGNGIGQGLLDYMVKPQYIEGTDEKYPSFGIMNDTDGKYKQYITKETETDAIYMVMANAPFNTAAHTNAQAQLTSGKVKFLEDERVAKNSLLGTKMGATMTPEERGEYLRPYTLTSILKDELMNLREETEGVNIILKRANTSIKKDKFSSLEYALYYIKEVEENGKRKKRFDAKQWKFFN